jgi:uncharacterized protein (TIGR04255 family)
MTSVAQPEYLAPFQRALAADYPILRRQQEVGFLLTPEGSAPAPQSSHIWRFSDREGNWMVSLAPTFVSLDTRTYPGEDEFLGRWQTVLRALTEISAPVIVDRYGLRYVNRLPTATGGELRRLFNPAVLGLLAEQDFQEPARLLHSVTETRVEIKDKGMLHARWAYLPPNVSLDPTIESAPEPTWVLDLDMGTASIRDFDIPAIMTLARDFHDVIYRFFRWAVSDELLHERGGTS